MKVSRYWHKETRTAQGPRQSAYALTSWGGSGTSPDEARMRALDRLAGWIAKLGRGEDLGDYDYATGDIREELIEEIPDGGDAPAAALTRNRYGSLVLNTASLFIADVDAEDGQPGWLRRLQARLGRPLRDKAWHLERIRAHAQAHPLCRLQVYETHAGLRVFATHAGYDPASDETRALLQALGSDPLYVALCRNQRCFRARLTPKPWRCGAERPPVTFPRQDAGAEAAFGEWLARYERQSQRYAVCRPLGSWGQGAASAEAAAILTIHDRWTVQPQRGELA